MNGNILRIPVYALLCLLLSACVPAERPAADSAPADAPGQTSEQTDAARSLRERFLADGTVVHAAGAVVNEATGETFLGANCLEGLTQSYAAGDRFVEIDFNFSSDGELVCIHDWQPMFSSAITGFDPLSAEEFLACRIYDAFTPMSLDTLAAFMEEHPDLCIITDVKDRNVDAAKLIAERYPALRDRFIVQIYNRDEYEPVRALGFENIIFTLYMLDWKGKTDTKALAEFAREHDLFAYTFGASLTEQRHYVDNMKKTGVPLLVHTVNGDATRQSYLDMGVAGVYTDYGRGYDNAPEEVR